MMAPAARHEVMAAAELVQTSHPREAAILGGIVRSTIDVGRIDANFVSRYTTEVIEGFGLVNVDRRPPRLAEIAMVVSRFQAYYARSEAP